MVEREYDCSCNQNDIFGEPPQESFVFYCTISATKGQGTLVCDELQKDGTKRFVVGQNASKTEI